MNHCVSHVFSLLCKPNSRQGAFEVTVVLTDLSLVWFVMQDAEEMHIKAIQIKEQLLGQEDYEVALSVGHLASLYNYDMNQYDDAERLYLRSIAIGEGQLLCYNALWVMHVLILYFKYKPHLLSSYCINTVFTALIPEFTSNTH